MAKIACIADSHFDETSRFAECVRLHDWIADDLEKRRPDVICHSGDLFERKSTPRERLAAARWLLKLAELAPVLMVRGNHDALGDLPIFSRLRAEHRIDVEEGCGIHRFRGAAGDHIAIAAIAWPRKAEVLAQFGHRANEHAAGDALRAMFRFFGQHLEETGLTSIVLMHAMVRGSRVSTGQPLMGCDFEIGLDDLGLMRADAYLLGHIHRHQAWDLEGAPVIYPGSPRRTAFGELETKGYVWLETGGVACHWERVEAPAASMYLLEDEWSAAEGRWLIGWHGLPETHEINGAEFRLRYRVASDQRAAAKHAASLVKEELVSEGAFDVRVEEQVVAVNRARLPEVARLRTLPEKLEALWRNRGFEPGERREPLLQKLELLRKAS